jgi:hypothetical protein
MSIDSLPNVCIWDNLSDGSAITALKASHGVREAHAYLGALLPDATGIISDRESEIVTRARELLAEMSRLEALKLEIIANPSAYPFPAFRNARDAYDAAYIELTDIKY